MTILIQNVAKLVETSDLLELSRVLSMTNITRGALSSGRPLQEVTYEILLSWSDRYENKREAYQDLCTALWEMERPDLHYKATDGVPFD